MILVDSCVWIDYLKGVSGPAVDILEQAVSSQKTEVCISGIVRFEVLVGITNARQREKVEEIFNKLARLDYRHESIDEMLRHALACRRHGVILPKLGDWLIIQTAIDHDIGLLTSDREFQKIVPYVPLRLVRS